MGIERVTKPTLNVLRALLEAHRENRPIHGWEIIKSAHKVGPTVYKILARLENDELITGEFEVLGPEESRPPRRYYRLTPHGAGRAEALLASRER
jgi:DNA-binding PadR family transcriptional regulator